MKIFKLKYVVLSLVLTTLVSCSKDSVIEAADKVAIAETDAFVFEDGINNYVVDGELTYDRKVIAEAAKDAWNVHYDYPHNKVVISTNKIELDKYMKSNVELKNALLENDKNDKAEIAKINTPQVMASTFLPTTGLPSDILSGFEDKNLIVSSYRLDNTKFFNQFVATSDDDLTNRNVYISGVDVVNNIQYPFELSENANYSYLFTGPFSYIRVVMINENSTSTLTKTFYKYKYYVGQSIIFTAPAHGYANLTNLVSFDPKSYK
ncbi:hypothetical protein [Flavobacterium sp.]|uniref:hypothetical protein n=1 Tax=Flavobacterium sp. TaxID=239 RepID=UPI00286E23BA|nr:hypothetical protein [Flavobacterium sp.]